MSETLTEPHPVSQKSEIAPEKKAGSDSREYFVYIETTADQWKRLTTVTATSAEQAIKSVQDIKEGMRYAAVPARNWTVAKPKVKVETTIQLELE